jgi:hypothetical protein
MPKVCFVKQHKSIYFYTFLCAVAVAFVIVIVVGVVVAEGIKQKFPTRAKRTEFSFPWKLLLEATADEKEGNGKLCCFYFLKNS